jgi:hypothetical protein
MRTGISGRFCQDVKLKMPHRGLLMTVRHLFFSVQLLIGLDVHNICRVKADLSRVPLHKFTKNRVGLEGKEYYSCSFKLQANFVGGNIEWSFIFDNKTYAAVTVSYDS